MRGPTRRQTLKWLGAGVGGALFAPHIARAAAERIRIGHNNTPSSVFHRGCLAFRDYVHERSGGRFAVEIYPSAQLGSDVQMCKAVSEGVLEASLGGISVLTAYNPSASLVELPYLFKDAKSARAAYDGSVGRFVNEAMAKTGIAILGYGESGFRHVTANRPIRAPEDLRGLKIRVQPAPIQVETFLGFGAAAEPLPFSELPEGLRTGRFEAQENPIAIAVANEFIQKLQSHFCLTAHVYSPAILIFSRDVLAEMSAQDIDIMEGGAAAATNATREFGDELTGSGLNSLKTAGMTIVDDVDVEAFQATMLSMTERFAKVADVKMIERIRRLAG